MCGCTLRIHAQQLGATTKVVFQPVSIFRATPLCGVALFFFCVLSV